MYLGAIINSKSTIYYIGFYYFSVSETNVCICFCCKQRTLREWRVVFWIMFAILFLSNCIFVWYGSADIQPWNELKKKNSSEEKEKHKHAKESHNKLTSFNGNSIP